MDSLKQRLSDALEKLPEVRLAALFGSAARNELRPTSDVDIGLSLTDSSLEARRRAEVTLGRAARREVDIVYLDESPPLLRFQIAREGILLVERAPNVWADFRVRAMLDWWDWAPIARRMNAAVVSRLQKKVERGSS